MGNFGNKLDEGFVRLAFTNCSTFIIEMLILEGYTLPDKKVLKDQTKIDSVNIEILISGAPMYYNIWN